MRFASVKAKNNACYVRSDCPISFTLDILGDKWTLLLLRDMMFAGKSSYGEFLQSDEKIATNVLADRLSVLEVHGLVTKKVASDKKSKFTYSLTRKGLELLPVIMDMTIWGAKYNPAGGNKALLKELKSDREGAISKYQKLVLVRESK